MLLYRLILCFYRLSNVNMKGVPRPWNLQLTCVTRLETISFFTIHQADVHLKHLEDRKVKDKTKKKSVSNV